jgi:hypothetical protein
MTDKKTIRMPADVLDLIRKVRTAGGYPSDTAALCAIIRIASPVLIDRLDSFTLGAVPTASRQRPDSVPTATAHRTDKEDPTLAAMAEIDFDLE